MIRRNDSQYSKFWMGGEEEFEFDPKKNFDAWDTDTLLRLASFKRAVANFARIVTGKSIPVIYNTGEQSYTQGSVVVLSAKLEHNQFDTAVGTALHEATHCVLTDFALHSYIDRYQDVVADMCLMNKSKNELRDLFIKQFSYNSETESHINTVLDGVDFDLVASLFNRLHALYGNDITSVSHTKSMLWKMSKLMENWVEDRRIDYFQFTTSPGYKGYYNAMYSSYFWSKLTGKAIRAKNYARTETWKSYKFRIINLLHPDTDLDALKGLREIWQILDIHHISRLKSTLDSWNLGFKILDVVLRYLELEKEPDAKSPTPTPEECDKNDSKSTSKSEMYDDEVPDDYEPSDDDESNGETVDKDNDTGDENLDIPDGEGTPFENPDIKDPRKPEESDEKDETLSPAQEKRMEKEEEKQDAFLEGDTKKKKMSKHASEAIKSLEESGVTLNSVGQGLVDGSGRPYKVQCVVIKKVTKELIDGAVFDEMFYDPNGYYDSEINENQTSVEEGFRLGTMLGKRLQIRNESRSTKFNRLETGRIDKKLLASLGYNNTRVFFRTMVDKYNPMMMHISVDASSSMDGVKWQKTLVLLVSIIKAASMTANLDVVVSIRGTTGGTNVATCKSRSRWGRRRASHRIITTRGYSIDNRPLIAIVYDSRMDKLNKVMSLFKYIRPGGTTPEGLAFEPIIDEMVVGKKNEMESVFVNISDGQPCFSANISLGDGSTQHLSYLYEEAAAHTASMVQKMRNLNIKILAYLIQEGSYRDEEDAKVFKKCYGRDARNIDTKNIVKLAQTLNEKFLEKNN